MYKLIFILIFAFLYSCSNQPPNKKTDVENKQESEVQKETPVIVENKPTQEKPEQITPVKSEMVFFEGGTFMMGSENGLPQEMPPHEVKVAPFYMDKSPVTVAQFKVFVEITDFKTEAEKFGDSGVFNFDRQSWELVPGATWRKPFGPSGPEAENNHPVTHVSWNDAVAYANWAGKRLPVEAEWEYAARSGKNSGERFSWGNQISENGKYFVNTWQGSLAEPETPDGYLFTSPVGAFGENEAGLTDMGGNVWQWCADVYKPYPGSMAQIQVHETVKVIRSGSFFYDAAGEASLTVSFRSGNSNETSLFNTGFRCAKDGE